MTFIFVRFCHFFSLHKVHCKCMQTSFCGAVLSHKIMFFNLLRYSKTSIETNIILTFSSLQKIHLEKSNFFFVTRLRRFSRSEQNMSLVCGGFNEKKRPLHSRLFFYRAVRAASTHQPFLRPQKKTYYKTPLSLTKVTKCMLRPQRRCSCEMCTTSPAPLLLITEPSVKPS